MLFFLHVLDIKPCVTSMSIFTSNQTRVQSERTIFLYQKLSSLLFCMKKRNSVECLLVCGLSFLTEQVLLRNWTLCKKMTCTGCRALGCDVLRIHFTMWSNPDFASVHGIHDLKWYELSSRQQNHDTAHDYEGIAKRMTLRGAFNMHHTEQDHDHESFVNEKVCFMS